MHTDRQQRGRRKVLRRAPPSNCYNSPNSQGNPVLRDPRVSGRRSSWAVDKQKGWGRWRLQQPRRGGLSRSSCQALSTAWRPAGERSLRLQLEQGRPDADRGGLSPEERGGVRLNKHEAKPMVLQPVVAQWRVSESQVAGKLITSWFCKLLKIKYSAESEAQLETAIYTIKGHTYAPPSPTNRNFTFGTAATIRGAASNKHSCPFNRNSRAILPTTKSVSEMPSDMRRESSRRAFTNASMSIPLWIVTYRSGVPILRPSIGRSWRRRRTRIVSCTPGDLLRPPKRPVPTGFWYGKRTGREWCER